MSGPTMHHFVRCCALAALLAFCTQAASQAATISYPDLGPVPPGISFTNIVESSGTDAVPLYGTPTAMVTGLDFIPTASFSSSAAGGASDITDGQLNYTMLAGPLSGGISTIAFNEAGSYSLSGAGAWASVGATLQATIMEVNGVAVAPIVVGPATDSIAFSLPTSALAGSWTVSLSLDVAAALSGAGYGPGDVATMANVVIDNSLSTASVPGAAAEISKTNLHVFVTPEPGSLALAGIALAAGVVRLRRARRALLG